MSVEKKQGNKILKRRLVLILLFFLGSTGLAFTNIGENFAPAGVEIRGGLSLYLSAGNIFQALNEVEYLNFQISSSIAVFIVQNLNLYINPGFRYTKYFTSEYFPSGSASWESFISAGITYYFLRNPEATTGFVPALKLAGRLKYSKDGTIYFDLDPWIGLLYFLTDRVAISFGIESPFWVRKDQEKELSLDDVQLVVIAGSGLSYFFPSRDRAIVRK